MAVVTILTSNVSYGTEEWDALYKNDGTETLNGIDFGNVETGEDVVPRWLYFRHDGLEPIYNAGYYLRTIGVEWGGYVATEETAHNPYNPFWFKHGGVYEDTGLPKSSTLDYDFLRNVAYNNPEMGIRVHDDRTNEYIRSNGLGNANKGLNFSPIIVKPTALDYSLSGNPQLDGYVYPEGMDDSKFGKDGDEMKLGISIKLPEDVVGSGHIQFAMAVKYRYTI